MQINSLADLLAFNANQFTVAQATVSVNSGDNTALITESATVLGITGQQLEILISVVNGALVSQPRLLISSMTLQQIAALGMLPASSYQSSQLPALTFSGITVSADPATRLVTLTGTAPQGPLALGISGVTIVGSSVTVTAAVSVDGTIIPQDAYFAGTLQVGGGVPIILRFPRGVSDWFLQSTNSTPVQLTNGLGDLTALTGNPLASLVPPQMPGVSQFGVGGLSLRLSTISQRIRTAELRIVSMGSWTVVPGALSISSVEIFFSLASWDGANGTSWQIGGSLRGTAELFGATCTVTVPIPPDQGQWVVSCTPGVSIPAIGGLVSNLSGLIGTGDLSQSLPPGLDGLGGLTVETFEIRFNPVGRTGSDIVQNVSFRLTNDAGWTLPYVSTLQLTDIEINLSLASPLGGSSQRVVTGALQGTIAVGDVTIPIVIARPTGESHWTLGIACDEIDVTLPDLVSVAGIDGAGFKSSLPPSLSIVSDLSLQQLSVDYDLTTNSLYDVGFQVGLTDTWTIIEDYLEVTDLALTVDASRPSGNPAWDYDVFLAATVDIATVPFSVTVASLGPGGYWTLTGRMQQGESFSLTDLIAWLLQKLLPSQFALPGGFPSIDITAMNVSITPETGAFSGAVTSQVSWSIPFLQSTFSIENLATTFNIEAAPDSPAGPPRPYTFTAGGVFRMSNLSSVQGSALLTLSSTSTANTIAVALSAGAAAGPSSAPLDAAAFINAIVPSASTSGSSVSAWDGISTPTDYQKPSFIAEAKLLLNLDTRDILAYGSFTLPGQSTGSNLYGAVALAISHSEAPSTDSSYALAAALENWSFGRLCSALSVMDGLIFVENAAVLLTTRDDTDTSVLATYVPAIQSFTTAKKGLNFSATLEFKSGLLSAAANLLGIETQGPFRLGGFIPSDHPEESTFQASLGSLKLLDVFTFENILLTYQAGQSSSFTLEGGIVVTVGTDYHFDGLVTVNRTTVNSEVTTVATASINSTQAIDRPLGIPALSLDKLSFDLHYQSTGTSSHLWYVLQGGVSFGPSCVLRGAIYFEQNSPSLVLITVANLDIGALFTKVFGLPWPSAVLPIDLKNGFLSYAPDDVTIDASDSSTPATQYKKGFFASSDVDIFFLRDFHVDVAIVDSGIDVSGEFNTPIDWGFVTFYHDQPALNGAPAKRTGPVVSMQVSSGKSGSETFTLAGAVALFGTPILGVMMNVEPDGISGTLEVEQDVPVFGRPTISFLWNDHGFQVTNWGLDGLALPQFSFDKFPKIPGECSLDGAIEIPVSSKLDLTTHFAITMATASGQSAPSPSLQLTLTGSLNLMVGSSGYADDPILKVDIGTTTLTVAFPGTGGFTWETLADSFIKCLTDAATSIFRTVFDDPKTLAKLLAVEGVVWAVDQVKDFLVCKGVESEIAEAFVEAAASDMATTFGSSILGVTGITLGGILGSSDSSGRRHNSSSSHHHHDDPSHPSDPGGDPDVPTPIVPSAPTLGYSSGFLTIAWTPPSDSIECAIIVQQDGKPFTQTNPQSTATITISAPSGHTYSALIVSQTLFGTSRPGPAASLTVLERVEINRAEYLSGNLIVSWTSPVTGAAKYVGRLYAADHTPIAGIDPVTIPFGADVLQLSIPIPGGFKGGSVCIGVEVVPSAADASQAGPTFSAPVTLQFVPAPSAVVVLLDGDTFVVQWSPVEGAVSYNFDVESNGTPTLFHPGQIKPEPNQGTNQPPPAKVSISADAFAPGVQYSVRVCAYGASGYSEWSPFQTFALVLPPTDLSFTFKAPAITVTWDSLAYASSFNVSLRNGSGTDALPAAVGVTGSSCTLDASKLPSGTYTGYVQTNALGQTSAWSQPVTVVIPSIPETYQIASAGLRIGTKFDDTSLALALNQPMTGIRLWASNVINMIQAVYGSTSLPPHGTPSGTLYSIDFAPGDVLQAMYATYRFGMGSTGPQTALLTLKFVTRSGKVFGPYPPNQPDPFNPMLPWTPTNSPPLRGSLVAGPQEQIIAFFGTVGWPYMPTWGQNPPLMSVGAVVLKGRS